VTHTLAAKVAKIGINPYVSVPARVSRELNRRGHVPVAGTLNRARFRANLVPVGGFRHRLYLNTDMRTRASVAVGDRVTITLALDGKPRIVSVPPLLRRALAERPAAKTAWDRLVPSHQKEILAYLNSLKRQESLERNVARVVAKLPTGQEVRRSR
jgi:hypothetical protein